MTTRTRKLMSVLLAAEAVESAKRAPDHRVHERRWMQGERAQIIHEKRFAETVAAALKKWAAGQPLEGAPSTAR